MTGLRRVAGGPGAIESWRMPTSNTGLASAGLAAGPLPASIDRVVANGDPGTRVLNDPDNRDASISADGRLITFPTLAALAPGDTNGQRDVFMKDLVTGAIQPG